MRERRGGFTLIEMIGVLAIISILAAMVVPKIFEAITDSKTTRAAAETQAYAAAVAKWYKDIGTLRYLSAGGAAQNGNTWNFATQLARAGGAAGLWTRWRGPYLDNVTVATNNITSPAVGTAAWIGNFLTRNFGAAVTANSNTNFDLNGDGNGDLANGGRLVFLRVDGVAQPDFLRIDQILDGNLGAGGNETTYGRVRWEAAAGGRMRIYLANN